MSEHRRRSSNPGGEEPSGREADGGRPYAYGNPPEGAPSYGRGGERPSGGRPTAQQPRLTRAEMRRQQGARGGAGAGGGNARRGAAAGATTVGRNGKPAKKRFIDYPRFGKTGFRRWIPSWKLQLSTLLLFFGAGVGAVGVAYAMTPIPDLNKVVESQNNIYYWADGSEMTRQGDTNRQVVELGDISKDLQNAAISTENATFWDDSGIDPKGIARAVYNMATGGETQGGSTITQQYVKNAYLNQDQTLSRKVRELFITLKVNQEDGKDKILTGYLNTSWFGRGATGAQAAAQAYYGVNAKDLNLCQSALLAGLLKGAALYDPATSPANHERAVKRWNEVLDRMVTTGAITKEKRATCAAFPEPVEKKPPASMNGQVSYMVELANKYLMSKDKTITEAAIAKGGFQVHTTFQKDKVEALKKAVDDFQADTLKPDKREKDKFVQIGAATVVPNDGAIVAIYGGPGVEQGHHTNNADTLGVPVGSTFKPFVLAAAMQYGVQTETGNDGKPKRINADSRYLADDKSEIHKLDGSPVIGDDGKPYHQKNSGSSNPGYVSLREAMRYSYNVPFVQLGQDVGTKQVGTLVEQMGLRKESLTDSSTTTFPLGTSTPSAIRLASAYSVFAARGMQTDPYSVSKVIRGGVELKTFAKPTPKPVLEEVVADNVTDVLTTVAKIGTGEKTNALGRPIAGKTGTTDGGKSAWWVGYTPSLVTSVGMWREEAGKPGLLTLDGTAGKDEVHGGDFPTDIFTRYMKTILNGQPKETFPKPGEIGEQVDSSGAPATASASATATATTPVPDPTTIAPTVPSLSPSAPATPSNSPSPNESCLLPAPLCPSGSPSSTRTKPPKPTGSGTGTGSPPATEPANGIAANPGQN
ncbi:transglycosylase domain-containing protein [Kitasatospora sp. NPDC101801]|uniref:transglycosylase domain-containing protein n=1 Tax=Kitasatospora sp. NPDC101801 TaxID=3364103 RepID=UPI003815AEEB